MFEIVSSVLKYVFTIIIYIFILNIIRLILLDIRSMSEKSKTVETLRYHLRCIGIQGVQGFRLDEVYPLDGDVSIGRMPENTLWIDDSFLSTTHALLIKKRKGYYLKDNTSTNGTFYNGKRLGKKAVRLKNGDKIRLGSMEFLFVADKGTGAP